MTSRLVRLVSTARHKYEGRWLRAGDEFEATQADAEDLLAIGYAQLAKPLAEKPKGTYRRRDMTAQSK